MRVKVWDLPIRLFHWLLVLALIGCYVTAELGVLDMQWHFRFGYLILGLLVFRLLWGFFGPRYARFGQFLRGPGAVWAYLRGDGRRWLGHNPLGGWAVLLLLLAVAFQVLTGLYNGDDIEWFGPLYDIASASTQKFAHRWHDSGFYVLLALIGVHVLAVLGYLVVKRQDLITPMVHGSKDGAAEDATEPGSLIALLLCVAVSVASVLGLVYLVA